jgi:antitoxin component YwqK of YwqJK toxin-antitoxin module
MKWALVSSCWIILLIVSCNSNDGQKTQTNSLTLCKDSTNEKWPTANRVCKEYKDDKLISIHFYRDSIKHGTYLRYYENGTLRDGEIISMEEK